MPAARPRGRQPPRRTHVGRLSRPGCGPGVFACVIERLRATLDRKPARRLPETWREYERRCASTRVTTECAIEREERARAFEAAELARLALAAA